MRKLTNDELKEVAGGAGKVGGPAKPPKPLPVITPAESAAGKLGIVIL